VASNAQKLHIIVTCTERKTAQAPYELQLRNVPDGAPASRAAVWTQRLGRGGERRPALDMYKGEHWQIAKSLRGLAFAAGQVTPDDVHLWTCSAGYGLIPADAPVRPYSATLTPGHADSVSKSGNGIAGRADAAAWWRAIADWTGPTPGLPRSFAALTARDPDATFLLVLSATYLQACAADIAKATTTVTDIDRFLIVSAGTRMTGEIGRLLLPADARLQADLGGTRGVLNVRIAAALLGEAALDRNSASGYLWGRLKASPGIRRYDRKPMSDSKVKHWITAALRKAPGMSASGLLRRFRDDGFACEQSRFSRLHRECNASLAVDDTLFAADDATRVIRAVPGRGHDG
jgi:hypothetical protein